MTLVFEIIPPKVRNWPATLKSDTISEWLSQQTQGTLLLFDVYRVFHLVQSWVKLAFSFWFCLTVVYYFNSSRKYCSKNPYPSLGLSPKGRLILQPIENCYVFWDESHVKCIVWLQYIETTAVQWQKKKIIWHLKRREKHWVWSQSL